MQVMPTVRYAIGDAGGIISFDEMLSFAERNGFDAIDEAKKPREESNSEKYVCMHACMHAIARINV